MVILAMKSYIMLFEEFNRGVTGYHYSSVELKIGDIITSNQHRGSTYNLVWKIFNEVNPDLPREYGYAYPHQKEMRAVHAYKVQASKCIKGNSDYSVFYTMDALTSLGFMKDKSIPLKERLERRADYIRQNAEKYFTQLDDPEKNELISDDWVVIEVLK